MCCNLCKKKKRLLFMPHYFHVSTMLRTFDSIIGRLEFVNTHNWVLGIQIFIATGFRNVTTNEPKAPARPQRQRRQRRRTHFVSTSSLRAIKFYRWSSESVRMKLKNWPQYARAHIHKDKRSRARNLHSKDIETHQVRMHTYWTNTENSTEYRI